jgi:hypothetical protein
VVTLNRRPTFWWEIHITDLRWVYTERDTRLCRHATKSTTMIFPITMSRVASVVGKYGKLRLSLRDLSRRDKLACRALYKSTFKTLRNFLCFDPVWPTNNSTYNSLFSCSIPLFQIFHPAPIWWCLCRFGHAIAPPNGNSDPIGNVHSFTGTFDTNSFIVRQVLDVDKLYNGIFSQSSIPDLFTQRYGQRFYQLVN